MENEIKVYMNTWANYNENGADLSQYGIESISDGWMDIEEAREFAEKYAEDEPFINDLETPFGRMGIDEYSNVEESLDMLEELANKDDYDIKIIKAIEEATGNDIEECIRIFEKGNYTWYPDVETDSDLGYEIIEEFGIKNILNPEYYIDTDALKRDLSYDVKDMIYEDAEDYVDNNFRDKIEVHDIPESLHYDFSDLDLDVDDLEDIETVDDIYENADGYVVHEAIENAIYEEYGVTPIDFSVDEFDKETETVEVSNIEFSEDDIYDKESEIEDYIDEHEDDYLDSLLDDILDNLDPSTIESYFDYEAFGRDLRLGDGYTFVDGGCIELY